MHFLRAPCLCIRFRSSSHSNDQKYDVARVKEAIKDIHDVLGQNLRDLRLLAVAVESKSRKRHSADMSWWKIDRQDRSGTGLEVKSISWWKGQQLWDRLAAMEYSALDNLQPNDVKLA